MIGWAGALLWVVQAGGAAFGGPERLAPRTADGIALRPEAERASAPACFADACPATPSLPGAGGRPVRTTRSDLALALLATLDAEPISGVARTIASSGVRLDFVPSQLDGGRLGVGKVSVSFRWPLDAWSGPLSTSSPGR
ncbi:MAG TPA: hypothetical protein VMT17_18695 [Anaeromyxobacteraceae bacterium]|nr:hypothetical protein [Anaeromyxobacteraceae bacterium]